MTCLCWWQSGIVEAGLEVRRCDFVILKTFVFLCENSYERINNDGDVQQLVISFFSSRYVSCQYGLTQSLIGLVTWH